MTNLFLNAALKYSKMGFSVIPLREREKLPLFAWAEFQKRRATEEEIRLWWEHWPNANVGIVTGMISGVAVVDLDGLVGVANGVRLKLSSSVMSLTGAGRQLFYKHREGVCNSASEVAEKVDVRGEGGYVVAPPS